MHFLKQQHHLCTCTLHSMDCYSYNPRCCSTYYMANLKYLSVRVIVSRPLYITSISHPVNTSSWGQLQYAINTVSNASLLASTCSRLGQTKLIIRFLFPPTCFLLMPQKFSLYGNLHHKDFQIFTNFSLLYCNFHYCNNALFSQDFSHNE